jgi:hypothetical protein
MPETSRRPYAPATVRPRSPAVVDPVPLSIHGCGCSWGGNEQYPSTGDRDWAAYRPSYPVGLLVLLALTRSLGRTIDAQHHPRTTRRVTRWPTAYGTPPPEGAAGAAWSDPAGDTTNDSRQPDPTQPPTNTCG